MLSLSTFPNAAQKIITAQGSVGGRELSKRKAVRGVPGLYRQTNDGRTSFVLRYTFDGKRREDGLGRISANIAVTLAKGRWLKILSGVDPRNTVARTESLSFREGAARYIASHRAAWKNAKHAEQWTFTLTTYAFPHIGDLRFDQIATPNIVQVLEPIWLSKHQTASRTRQRMEKIFDWAKVSGYRTGENPARWLGHLDKLLPAKAGGLRNHQPAIHYDGLNALMARLANNSSISAGALEFLILTAARTNEITQARWSEIDGNVWTVPASRMKSSREHRVPLGPRAMKLLESLPREENSDFVFPGAISNRPISNAAMQELLKSMKVPSTTEGRCATVHGMRSAFRDWAAERTNFPRELAEAALAHVLGNKTEAAYQRGDLLLKRRKMMEAWESFLARSPAAVVQMRKAQQGYAPS